MTNLNRQQLSSDKIMLCHFSYYAIIFVYSNH